MTITLYQRLDTPIDTPYCGTNKGQERSFLAPKIWIKLISNIKTATATASVTVGLKKDIIKKL